MTNFNAMEQDDEKKKKMNDDVVVFMRKRSETEAPRYTARLKTYVDIQQKHRRAAAARRHSEHGFKKVSSASRKKEKVEGEQKLPGEATEHTGNEDERTSRRGQANPHGMYRGRSFSGSGSDFEPSDRRCGRRRKRRCCSRRRARRRPCRRRRSRRRRCRRRRSRRRCRSRRRRRRKCCKSRRRRSRRRRRRC